MNNEKRLNKTLQILANRLTKHEYEEVSILLNILWGGVSFGYDNILDFSHFLDLTYKKNYKKVRDNKIKILNLYDVNKNRKNV